MIAVQSWEAFKGSGDARVKLRQQIVEDVYCLLTVTEQSWNSGQNVADGSWASRKLVLANLRAAS